MWLFQGGKRNCDQTVALWTKYRDFLHQTLSDWYFQASLTHMQLMVKAAMSHGSAQPQITRDPRLLEGWRAAAAAYRRVYGEPRVSPHRGCADEACKAAIAALKDVLPDMTDREAMLEAIAAVHYASWAHPEWLYALYKSDRR